VRYRFSFLLVLAAAGFSQEAQFGFASPITVSFLASHNHRADIQRLPGGTVTGAFRTVLYPTLKLGAHWFGYAAVDIHSSPYYYSELTSRAREIYSNLLQGYVGYSRVSEGRALTVKVGQLSSAFGSFPTRYDDARNWLIDVPQTYGHYYSPVSLYGLPGAEIDAVLGKADFRLQFTNSSPSNPRHLWESDQYGGWTGGGGVTIRQGFRVGGSAFRGPYLYRGHRFFFPGEAKPKELPATGQGADVQWARGHWNVNGEFLHLHQTYRLIPHFITTAGYGEVKFTINPRWFLAGRAGTRRRTAGLGRDQSYELVVGFRPMRDQLLKVGYLALQKPVSPATRDNVLGIQYVFTFNPPAWTF